MMVMLADVIGFYPRNELKQKHAVSDPVVSPAELRSLTQQEGFRRQLMERLQLCAVHCPLVALNEPIQSWHKCPVLESSMN